MKAKSRGQALRDYVFRRLLLMIPTFIGITFATFLLCQFVPGGQIDQMRMALSGAEGGGDVGGSGGDARLQLDIPDEQLKRLNEYYGFDKPLHIAYASWLADTVRLDLGTSFRYNEPVTKVIAERLPVSIYYGIITAIFTYGICIPLGILKAIRHRTSIDTATSVLIFVGYAVPGFALGAVLSNLFSVRWELFPLGGFQSAGAEALGAGGLCGGCDLAFRAAPGGLPGRLVCGDHHADEEQPAREHERRLRQDCAWPRA